MGMKNILNRFMTFGKAALCLVPLCICFVLSASYDGTAFICEAKTDESLKTDDKAVKEIEEFVTAFYEAHTKNGIDSLGNYIEDKENLDIYVAGYEAAFAYGFQKYDNIDVDVYSLYQDEYWMAHIYHDMVIEDSDVRLPGMVAYLVHKGEDGNYYIIIEDANSVEVSEDVTAEIKRILQTDEVIE